MRKTLVVVALALVSGCGKKGSEAKGDCTTAVDHAVTLSADEYKKNNVDAATQQKIRDASIARCKEDKWTNEVLKCFVDAKQADDIAKCQQMLSAEQNENLSKAIAIEPEGSGAATPEPAPDAGSAAEAPAAPSTGMPAECEEYKTYVDKLAACDKIPTASRDMLKKAFDDSSKGWADFDKLPAEMKTALTNGCKQGADALKKAAGPACGF